MHRRMRLLVIGSMVGAVAIPLAIVACGSVNNDAVPVDAPLASSDAMPDAPPPGPVHIEGGHLGTVRLGDGFEQAGWTCVADRCLQGSIKP